MEGCVHREVRGMRRMETGEREGGRERGGGLCT